MKRAIEMYEFDTALTTFNPTKERLAYEESFLPAARQKGLGIIAMKTMGGAMRFDHIGTTGVPGVLVGDGAGKTTPENLLRYALSLPLHTAICGMRDYAQLRQDLAALLQLSAAGGAPAAGPAVRHERQRPLPRLQQARLRESVVANLISFWRLGRRGRPPGDARLVGGRLGINCACGGMQRPQSGQPLSQGLAFLAQTALMLMFPGRAPTTCFMNATTTRRSNLPSILLAAAIAALCGCGKNPQANRPAAPAARAPVPAAAGAKQKPASVPPAAAPRQQRPTERLPSDAEAQTFAQSFEQTLMSGNAVAVDAAINWDAIFAHAMSGIEAPEDVKRSFETDARAFFSGPKGLALRLIEPIAKGGRYRLLRVHRQGNEQRALFRFEGERDFRYKDCILLRSADGKISIGDFYDYINGRLQSDDIRQENLRNAAKKWPASLEKLSPLDRDYATHLDLVLELGRQAEAGRFREAMDVYEKLPDRLKNRKSTLQYRLQACRAWEQAKTTKRSALSRRVSYRSGHGPDAY